MEQHSSQSKPRLVDPKIIIPFILLTSCFAWWGLANNMTDTLLAAFKRIKSMTDVQTSFIQLAFYGAYFCFALPAALFIRKFTYKSGVLLGLALFIIGGLLFYPSSLTMEYGHFLASLYILAAGLSILETSANPYILVLGPEKTATQRLNLAQSFNPIGSILGIYLSKEFILSKLQPLSKEERMAMDPEKLQQVQSEELTAVMGPYVAVAFLLMVIWIALAVLKMPKESDDDNGIKVGESFKRLFANKTYIFGVLALFFYMGAQIGCWSFTIRYGMHELGLEEEGASVYYMASLIVFAVSRFICTGMMSYIKPVQLLGGLGLLGALLCLLIIFVGGMTGVIALVLTSLCMSLMFPTIYGLALDGVGPETKKFGGAGLIMAILGGAVITPLQGVFSDGFGINMSFFIPLGCFLAVMIYAIYYFRKKKVYAG